MLTKFRLKSVSSGHLYEFEKPSILIGRSTQCDICVDSGLLSRHHASVLVVNPDTAILKDLDSTNGTFINTMKIARPTPLNHGDVITIGDEKLIFIDTERQVEPDPYDSQMRLADDAKAIDAMGNNNTMIESSFFRSINLPPAHYTMHEPSGDNSQFVAQVLGERRLDANRTPAVMIIQSGSKRGTLIELKLPVGVDREWSLGRSQLCDVVLEDPTVSNCHAMIRWENGLWDIQDNQSTNGVSVNDKKVTRTVFESGDVITIGSIKLLFRVL